MPPFGSEKEEPTPKPLPYWSARHASKKKASSTPATIFGDEPPEVDPPSPVVASRPSQTKKRKPPSSAFQDEPDEPAQAFQHERPKSKPKQAPLSLFQDEGEEQTEPVSESSSDEDQNEEVYKGTSKTVFSLGWHTLMDFKKSTFWNKNQDAPAKPKRMYDNSTRAAAASYSRQQTAGTYRMNGKDPARIEGLLALASCHCSLLVPSKVVVS